MYEIIRSKFLVLKVNSSEFIFPSNSVMVWNQTSGNLKYFKILRRSQGIRCNPLLSKIHNLKSIKLFPTNFGTSSNVFLEFLLQKIFYSKHRTEYTVWTFLKETRNLDDLYKIWIENVYLYKTSNVPKSIKKQRNFLKYYDIQC